MTAQAFQTAGRRRRRKAARQRLPRDLILLVLILAAIYVAARLAIHLSAPPQMPTTERAYEAPVAIPVHPPALAPTAPHPGSTRRTPQHVLPEPSQIEEADRDPFEGLERLSAAELDTISQAR